MDAKIYHALVNCFADLASLEDLKMLINVEEECWASLPFVFPGLVLERVQFGIRRATLQKRDQTRVHFACEKGRTLFTQEQTFLRAGFCLGAALEPDLAANSDGRYFRGAGSSSTNGWADPGVNLWSCGKTGRQGGQKLHTV
jgi:hypothetical protein